MGCRTMGRADASIASAIAGDLRDAASRWHDSSLPDQRPAPSPAWPAPIMEAEGP